MEAAPPSSTASGFPSSSSSAVTKCSFCVRTFGDEKRAKQHEEDRHGREFFEKYGELPRRYTCAHPGCKQVFLRQENLDRHVKSHERPSQRRPISPRHRAIEEAESRKTQARNQVMEAMENKGVSWEDLDAAVGERHGYSRGVFVVGFTPTTLEHLNIVSRCLGGMPIEELRKAVGFGMMIHGPPRAPDAQDNIRIPRPGDTFTQ